MQSIEKRALYNLLRMNWLSDPQLMVEPWQVEDYRLLSLSELFDRLNHLAINLNKESFQTHADFYDSPESLTEHLIGDRTLRAQEEDKIYLAVFELWRQLVTEKPSISIFCDELDHLIFLYDHDQLQNFTLLHDALANLLVILDENVDEGLEPKEAFELISNYCANDLQTFLYDFIAEQIDDENESYAQELLDDFDPYLGKDKWFAFLRVRLVSHSNPRTAHRLLTQLIEEYEEAADLEFNLEVLSFMTEIGNPELFNELASQTLLLLKTEEDLQDFLAICADYYHRLDNEVQEKIFQELIQKRNAKPKHKAVYANDSDVKHLMTLLKS